MNESIAPEPSQRRRLMVNLAVLVGLAALVASSFYVGLHAGRAEERRASATSTAAAPRPDSPSEAPVPPHRWKPVEFTDRYADSPFGEPEHGPYEDDLRVVRRVTDDGALVLSTVDERGKLDTRTTYSVLSGVILPDLPDDSAQCRIDALDALRAILAASDDRVYVQTVAVPYTGISIPGWTSVAEVWTVEPGTGRADALVNQELITRGQAWADADNRSGDWRRLAEASRTTRAQPCEGR